MKPNKNEQKDDFMKRCMSDDEMMSEYPDQKQRAAVCLGQHRNMNKSKSSVLYDFVKEIIKICKK